MENNLIITKEENNLINGNKITFHTLDLNNKEDKIKLYNSLQQCDILLNDIKNQTIEINDLYIEKKLVDVIDNNGNPVINEETGEVRQKDHYRIILYGTDGKTYVSSSYGVFNSITQIVSIFGRPSKDNVLKLKVSEKSVRNSNFKSLVLLYVNE